ncbi:hypothetical protein EsH8_III_001194 [Colletotrichum jinshuiense]
MERNKMSEEALRSASEKRGVPKKTPDNDYQLMPGETPYPDWPGPAEEECQIVYDILINEHATAEKEDSKERKTLKFKPPEKIPPPSTTVAGCGEVPDLVDAMMRTLISQHTQRERADQAVDGIIKAFGQLEVNGIGAGSINWDKVRLSSEEDVVKVLTPAGLGKTKYGAMKKCLDMIYDENQLRKIAYIREAETGEPANVSGATNLTQGQKDHQLLKINSGVLTLDHIRIMSADEAMLALTKYPQVGVKTASCLLLFCLQLPSFAVDTHVWRISRWLGWAPRGAGRDDTYKHCNVRVPDRLKYGLHQLFIEHGSTCYRCRGGTLTGTKEWEAAVCPLEHLLSRFDKRMAKQQTKKIMVTEKQGFKMQTSPEGSTETVFKQELTEMITKKEDENDNQGFEEPHDNIERTKIDKVRLAEEAKGQHPGQDDLRPPKIREH